MLKFSLENVNLQATGSMHCKIVVHVDLNNLFPRGQVNHHMCMVS